MVTMLLGLPGNGKSLTACRRLLHALGHGRTVVTNLPLNAGECADYIEKHFGFEAARTIGERLVVVDSTEMKEVFRIRGPGCGMPEGENWKSGERRLDRCYQFEDSTARPWKMSKEECEAVLRSDPPGAKLVKTPPTEYYLDEVQNVWPARGWQELSAGMPYWLSQHRHLGDNVCLVTQREMQVDRIIRGLTQEFLTLTNFNGRRRWGMRLPGWFAWSRWEEPPGGLGARPVEAGAFRLDVEGVAKCYSTVGGMGIDPSTGSADIVKAKRGFSWMWAVGAIVIVMILASFVPTLIGRAVGGVLLGASSGVAAAVKKPVETKVKDETSTLKDEISTFSKKVKDENSTAKDEISTFGKKVKDENSTLEKKVKARIKGAFPLEGGWRIVVERDGESFLLCTGEPDVGAVELRKNGELWAVYWQEERVTWR